MAEKSEKYLYFGVVVIVLLSLFVYLSVTGEQEQNSGMEDKGRVTISLSDGGSGTESFSTYVDEEQLFSGEPFVASFSPKGREGKSLNCIIECEQEGR